MKSKILVIIFLIMIFPLTGCIGDQVKQIVENNVSVLNETIQATAYNQYVEFGSNLDTQTGSLYGQSSTNTFSVSSIQNIYARLTILATNNSTFSLKYDIKLNGGSNIIADGTVTGNITPGVTPYYVVIILPVAQNGSGTYTIDFFESSDPIRAIASGSCKVE